jgi:hypothetical protein
VQKNYYLTYIMAHCWPTQKLWLTKYYIKNNRLNPLEFAALKL